MATLFNLVGDWNIVYGYADDAEMSPEVWFDTMEAIQGNLECKAEGYAKIYLQLGSDIDALDKEIARLQAIKNPLANKQKYLKEHFKDGMVEMGLKEIKAGIYTWKIANNGGKLPLNIAEGTDVASLPEEYLTRTVSINNEAVRKALDEGQELGFASYGERGTNLRLK